MVVQSLIRNLHVSAARWQDGMQQGMGTHKVNNFERRMLVWSGHYKTVDDVPKMVSASAVERARSRLRIRVANIFMVLTGVACVYMVWSGKKAHREGESVSKQNMDWHARYNEDKRQEELKKAAGGN